MRVMATRPDGQHGFNDPAMQTLSATIATPLVALLDPAAARTILGQIEARSGLSPAELAKIAGEWWLAAWALVGPEARRGTRRGRARRARQPRSRRDLGNSALLRMTEALLTPPDRREELFPRRTALVAAGLSAERPAFLPSPSGEGGRRPGEGRPKSEGHWPSSAARGTFSRREKESTRPLEPLPSALCVLTPGP